jgi:hypothetical protein
VDKIAVSGSAVISIRWLLAGLVYIPYGKYDKN